MLRADIPQDMTGEVAEHWLNSHRPGWEAELPLRLSEATRVALLRPALSDAGDRLRRQGGMLQRVLHRRADANGWAGAIRIPDGTTIPYAILPAAVGPKVLRLVTEQGPVFRATAEVGGWRVSAAKASTMLAAAPDRACMMTAYADGRLLGEFAMAPGLPSPEEAPSLWRPTGSDGEDSELIPISSPRSAARRLWLLAPEGVRPVFSGDLEPGVPERAPGGLLWPVAGRGVIHCGDTNLHVETACDRDDPDTAALLPLAANLVGWVHDDGLPVYLGDVRFLGFHGERPARDVTRQVGWRTMRNVLGGQVVEWTEEGGAARARIAMVVLPAALSLKLCETESGCAETTIAGLPAGWLAMVEADGVAARKDKTRRSLVLEVRGARPGMVSLTLSDPATGRRLRLSSPWPARDPVLIDPGGKRLQDNRAVSLTSLVGWRGMVPAIGGSLQLRAAAQGRAVAFAIGGMQRLSAWSALVSQAMALAGADGRVNLRLTSGPQTPRLEIGRYDWTPARRGNRLGVGTDRVCLRAITLEAPHVLREVVAEVEVDLSEWLGDMPQLWFVQGRSDRGVMRPEAWSAQRRPRSTREQRIAGYHADFRDMLEQVDHQGWDQLVRLIRLAREAGDCGALDQIQALAGVPAVAVVLLFRMKADEIAQTFALETEAPFWWPLIPYDAWGAALEHFRRYQFHLLEQVGMVGPEAEASVRSAIARRVAAALLHRPELKAHFGIALARAGFPPVVPSADSGLVPLLLADPQARLRDAARGLAARAPEVPQGAAGIVAPGIEAVAGFSPDLRPILDAPLAVAAMSTGRQSAVPLEEVLQLLALRHADSEWFDSALPLALQYLAEKSHV